MIRLGGILAHIILQAAAWLCFAAAWGLALLDCARSAAFSRLNFAPLSAVLAQISLAAAGGRAAELAALLPAFMVFLLAGLILYYLSFWRPNWRQPWLHWRRRWRRRHLPWRRPKAGLEIGDKLCP